MTTYLLSQFPALIDSGLSGYGYLFRSIPNPFSPSDPTPASGILLVSVLQNSSPSAMDSLLSPYLAHINATWPNVFTTIQLPSSHPTFYDWFRTHFDTSPAGRNILGGSRLLSREDITRNLTATAGAVEALTRLSGSLVVHLVSGPGVAQAKPRGGENAVCPAWRRAYLHVCECFFSTFLFIYFFLFIVVNKTYTSPSSFLSFFSLAPSCRDQHPCKRPTS